MEISLKITALLLATLGTGLTAGLCFTWANAVTPGIGQLGNLGYLSAFQAMNRSILNPTFFLVFLGPMLLQLINIWLFRAESHTLLWVLIGAAVLYFFGLVLVTVFGNVPLNEMLDQTVLENATAEDLQDLRTRFESAWNRFHRVRVWTTVLSFLVLLIGLVLSGKLL